MITFAMLADSSLPTPKEHESLLAWLDRRDRCWKESEALHQAQWPAEIFELSQEGNAAIHTIGLELYHRKITFGEANKQIENGGNAVRAKLIPIIKRYQDEIAAQKAAAAQIAAQKQDASDRLAAQLGPLPSTKTSSRGAGTGGSNAAPPIVHELFGSRAATTAATTGLCRACAACDVAKPFGPELCLFAWDAEYNLLSGAMIMIWICA